ncbi:Hypothetical protein CINCED_3A000745 [Cinara cedri]|uniref:Uncharacterized protein n=1 Tax=Cinara cedri TaxID=506608 RepID=A0A5E4MRK6_9HEMI|nr:Hypothetical protein CINCED_3A000745 [Cinara cedri]
MVKTNCPRATKVRGKTPKDQLGHILTQMASEEDTHQQVRITNKDKPLSLLSKEPPRATPVPPPTQPSPPQHLNTAAASNGNTLRFLTAARQHAPADNICFRL